MRGNQITATRYQNDVRARGLFADLIQASGNLTAEQIFRKLVNIACLDHWMISVDEWTHLRGF